jgi:hypothetical protein
MKYSRFPTPFLITLPWRKNLVACYSDSDIQAKQEPHWVESITISPPAEEGELGRWAG